MRSPTMPIVLRNPGQEEAVDVRDPQERRARGPEVGGQQGHREIEDGQVHRVEQAGKRDHGEADPLHPPARGASAMVIGAVSGSSDT